MKLKRIFSSAGNLLFPPKCSFCGETLQKPRRDEALCTVCEEKWMTEKNARCKYCRRKHTDCVCKLKYGARFVDSDLHITGYTADKNDVATKLILMNKDKNIASISRFFASEAVGVIKERIDYRSAYVVNCPRKVQTKNETGYDQTKNIAVEISKLLGLKYIPAIKRKWGTERQKELDGQERIKNSDRSYTFRSKYRNKLYGKKILLIDDVSTTGSTLGHCAELLRINGAGSVHCVYIARTNIPYKPKENSTKNEGKTQKNERYRD